jgi:hypothetical protein
MKNHLKHQNNQQIQTNHFLKRKTNNHNISLLWMANQLILSSCQNAPKAGKKIGDST